MVTGVSINSPSFLTPAKLAFGRLTDEAADGAARLTSGSRILRASDDASSLSLAQRLKSQIVELEQSSRNVAFNDTLVSVAGTALTNIKDLLDEAAELAERANSDSQPEPERAISQQRLIEILDEIDAIAESTRFNNQQVLDGSLADSDIVVGAGAEDSIDLAIPAADVESLFSGELPDISSQANAADAETQIAEAQEIVATAIGALDGVRDRLLTAETNIRSTLTGVEEGRSALEDIDFERELQAFTRRQIQVDVATAVIAQAERLSSDLLDVLNFPLPEITGQEEADEAETETEISSQPSPENNALSSEAA